MVAVEGGKKAARRGGILTCVPDRVADAIILAFAVTRGWHGMGTRPRLARGRGDLHGVRPRPRPLARDARLLHRLMLAQHRMATLTAANLLAATVTPWVWHRWVLLTALASIIVASVKAALDLRLDRPRPGDKPMTAGFIRLLTGARWAA